MAGLEALIFGLAMPSPTLLIFIEVYASNPRNGSLYCRIPGIPVPCKHYPAANPGVCWELRWPQKQGPAPQVCSQALTEPIFEFGVVMT